MICLSSNKNDLFRKLVSSMSNSSRGTIICTRVLTPLLLCLSIHTFTQVLSFSAVPLFFCTYNSKRTRDWQFHAQNKKLYVWSEMAFRMWNGLFLFFLFFLFLEMAFISVSFFVSSVVCFVLWSFLVLCLCFYVFLSWLLFGFFWSLCVSFVLFLFCVFVTFLCFCLSGFFAFLMSFFRKRSLRKFQILPAEFSTKPKRW
jgi:hypothetical protein